MVLAFAAIYLIWGSTYLAIKIAGETLPPFLLAGVRHLVAGAALFGWAMLRGASRPTGREWLGAAGVGTFLVVLSNAPIVWVEREVDSGVVALFTSLSPILVVIFNRIRLGTPIRPRVLGGIALGTVGLAILATATLTTAPHPFHTLVIIAAVSSWAIGITFGRAWPTAHDVMTASGAQMLVGGGIASLIGLLGGELNGFQAELVSTRSVLAWGYLTIFGSMVTYTAYQWLLRHVEVTKVATSTYVNPIVAILLGVTLGGERLDPRVLAAAGFLVPAVVMVIGRKREKERKREGEKETSPA
jgi:drug/metabolite transporter (DMT)-like permease